MIRCLQVNLGRGCEAQDLLMQAAIEKRVDILLISEQYWKPKTGTWFHDTTSRSAIVVLNNNMIIGKVCESEANYTWADIDGTRVYSFYFSPNIKHEEFLTKLTKLEDSLRTAISDVLIAGDFNCKSPEWGSRKLDKRGEALSEMIARLNLVVLNEGNTFTFRRGHTGSVVDITLASEGIAARATLTTKTR